MSRVSGPLKSSANAGQLSKSLRGKVNLKQYYSGAIRMYGVEPIAQSGFNLMPGSAFVGAGVSGNCSKAVLNISDDLSYTIVVTTGRIDIWRNDRVHVATLNTGVVAAITAEMVPDLRFYGEANTVGIWHVDLWDGIRLLRDPSNDTIWTPSAWPYGELPDVDLGGTYTKTDDVWTLYLRWAEDVGAIYLAFTVDGNTTNTVLLNAGDFPGTATAFQAAIAGLPGFSSGVDVDFVAAADEYAEFKFTFGGVLSGSEYQFDAQITNTSNASALASHTTVGDTEGEPLISATRGGFRGMSLYQDRAFYYGAKAKSASTAASRIGEYFDLNIEAQQDNAARLDALRSETAETILYLVDATYLVAFTNKSVYFVSNRTIERNKPLNWVNAIEVGIKRNCRPVKLEGKLYFVSSEGGRLYSIEYDAVSEMFTPTPVNDLNGSDPADLVRDLKDLCVQHKTGAMAGDRLWLLRDDGRLICGIVNVNQEIPLAAAEWPIPGGGFVHAISVDGQEQVWLTVERSGVISEEILEEESSNLFQCSFSVTTDLTGQASGLSLHNGRAVWALIDNDVFGPFTVSAGKIDTGQPSKSAIIGLWTAPVYESMPYVRVLQNDDVVIRPGKVGSVRFYVEETASIAIGANGRPVKDVPLQLMGDDLSQPKQNFTGRRTVAGIKGACMDPTLVISQVRPGRLHVRDFVPGVKL